MKISEKLTTKEVAILLRTSRGVLANWRCYGEGPPFIRTGKRGKILYDARDLERWLECHKVHTIASLEERRWWMMT